MSVIRTSIKRPVTASMVTIGVLAFGVIALTKLPINLLPDLSYPTLTLETRYPGAAPDEVEYLVTRQIEEAVSVIPNIKRVSSSSKPELSQVTIEFNWGRQMDFAILDVSKKVDLLRFPDGVEKPRILRYDPNQDPIMKVSVTSGMPLTDLRYFGEEDLKKRLDSVPGLASVKVSGGQSEIIEVYLDEAALKRFGLTIETVSQRLREENINRAGGSLYENEARYLVRTLNEFRSIDDIGDTIVSRNEDRKIYLREVADIRYGHEDQVHIARINGKEGIELAFYKEGDANTVQVSRSLEAAMEGLKEKFKDQVEFEVTYVGATFIQAAVKDVIVSAALGGLIAIFVLLLFLRDLKSTFVVALAIPISVFATFFLMLQFGISLNIMSLGGLALGIGMLVDNSIVVLESIFVRSSQGEEPTVAAEQGASMVSGAVIASTLTTIVVFLPIVFVQGIGGQLFRDLGMSVSFSLLASLIVSLTLMPMAYVLVCRFSYWVHDVCVQMKRPWLLVLFPPALLVYFWNRREVKPRRLEPEDSFSLFAGKPYTSLLTYALRFRWVVLLLAVLLVFQAGQLWRQMGVSLVPEMSQGDYYALIELDEGTPISKTDKIAAWAEEQVMAVEGVKTVFTNIGNFDQGVETRTGENLAQVNFALEADVEDQEAVVEKVRNRLAQGPNLEFQIGTPSYFSFRTPVEIEIYHENRERLEALTGQVVGQLDDIPHIVDIRSTVAEGNPEVQVTFKRETMSQLGLSIGTVAQLLRDKIQGTHATQFVRSGRDVDIMVRLRERDRQSLEQIDQLTIGYRDGRPIFLSSVADINLEVGPSQIKRISQRRCAVVTAGIDNGDLGGASDAIAPILAQLKRENPDATIQLSGQNAEMNQSFRSLLFATLLAIFLVYLVMASQFESLVHPFLILFTIPIGLVGGLVALYLANLELSVIAMIGLVMLAGIVVNNAIVLIDYINQLRRSGMPLYESIVVAGNRRFRPIMMTTTTTVLGLLPMAVSFGSGSEMRTPLAIAVIGGLVFSTVLTLIIIPVLYGTVTRGLHLPSRASQRVEGEVTA